jgi:hypothetical protein
MEIEINYNVPDLGTETQLLEIGATKRWYDDDSDYYFAVDLNTMEELEALSQRIENVFGIHYDMIVGFDHPTIFIDKNR